MKANKCLCMLFFSFSLCSLLYGNSSVEKLTLKKALEIVKKENLEIKIANENEKIKALEHKIAKGNNYGKLDFSVTGLRSNDPGNVFGFKVQSEEATFRDFGFDEFLVPLGKMMKGETVDQNQLLNTKPKELNEPDARNHYITKLTYQIPLYTGGMLTQYGKITKSLHILSKLDKDKILNEKLYQTKKTFYDISLLESFIKNLSKIKSNIQKLEKMVSAMIDEGYAKKVDLLEVSAKKSAVDRMLHEAKFNKELALQYLSFLLNKDVKSIVAVYDEVPMLIMSKEKMLENNIDIQKAKKGYEITKMAVKLKEAPFLPMVGAFAEYSTADDTLFGEFSEHMHYTVGFQATWNIFNGTSDYNELEKAKVDSLKVATQVKLAKKGIALKIKKIKTNIKSLDYRIKALKEELKFAREVYENYLGRYQEKLVSINDILIKQSIEIEKVLKLQMAKNTRNEQIFTLEKIANGVER